MELADKVNGFYGTYFSKYVQLDCSVDSQTGFLSFETDQKWLMTYIQANHPLQEKD